MVRAIVDQVAALAQALEIAPTVIARVMIEVRRGQDHASSPHLCRLLEIGPSGRPAAAVAPRVTGGVEPTAIRQTAYSHAMWPAASLAHASGALEPHAPADLWPIAGVEPPHFRLDRHRHPRSRDGGLLGQHAINACPANAEPDLVSNSANTPNISRNALPVAVPVSTGCLVAFKATPLALSSARYFGAGA